MKMTKTIAVENADKHYQKVQENKLRKAQEFCDTIADKAIEEASKEGNRQCHFYNVDFEIIYEVCNILKAQGFTTSVYCTTTLFVKWH